MAVLPLLTIPSPKNIKVSAGIPQIPPKPQKLTASRQSDRLGSKFDAIDKVLNSKDGLRLQDDPTGIAPERALVFEVADSIERITKAIAAIPGLEMLLEDEISFKADDDFRSVSKTRDKTTKELQEVTIPSWSGRLYLMMPTLDAMRVILSLWKLFQEGKDFPRGKTPWRDLFSLLKDVRAWGPKDRVSESTIAQWEEDLSISGNKILRFEAELWSTASSAQRINALNEFSDAIRKVGGKILATSDIPEIRYLAALADIDGKHLPLLKERDGKSIDHLSPVMYLLPQTTPEIGLLESQEVSELASTNESQLRRASPRIVLLDGVPIQNHQLLRDNIMVEDPDGFEADTPVAIREHGTAMASIIVHGDRAAQTDTLLEPILVRPILKKRQVVGYSPNGPEEGTPEDQLFVDLVHRAVREILVGDSEKPATCPSAIIFNFSIGDRSRPFAGSASPLARLLDYLSHKHSVLFIVSAGNITKPLSIKGCSSLDDFKKLNADDRQLAVLRAVDAAKWDRSLLSPAESLNSLTIGSAHNDSLTERTESPYVFDPFQRSGLPNVSSALGLGILKSIKPDALEMGGREFIRISFSEGEIAVRPAEASPHIFGIKAACSSGINKERFFAGTSISTALVTRGAAKVLNALEQIENGDFLANLSKGHCAALIKALVCHSALWNEDAAYLTKEVFQNGNSHHSHRNENTSRFLGNGLVDLTRVLTCIDTRATLVYAGGFEGKSAKEFEVPLPASLGSKKDYRRLIFTLAWLTPINVINRYYSEVSLEINPHTEPHEIFGAERRGLQPYKVARQRGTVFHDIYEGERAVAFEDNATIKFKIECHPESERFEGTIPFGLAVTIEAKNGSEIPIYSEIRERLSTRIATRSSG